MSIIIHGGAGAGNKDIFDEDMYNTALNNIMLNGVTLLKNNTNANIIAVELVKQLEDNYLFNAGIGSTTNNQNNIFHDACFVNGTDLTYGSIALSNIIKNPIDLCYKISLNNSFMIAGNDNIKNYCSINNYPTVNSNIFSHPYRKHIDNFYKDCGTVGCVVRDFNGNISAATSTGGTHNKIPGRIGDTFINGISTFADNNLGGISTTGKGEDIIKYHIASDIIFRYKYTDITFDKSISLSLNNIKTSCGIIAIDKNGNIFSQSNTERFFRSYYNYKNDKIITKLWN